LTTTQTAPQLAAAGPEAPLPEIRAARRDELDQVAGVRSEAFSLPREHWPPLDRVSDPELERIRVVVRAGRVVSCLNIRATRVQVGGATLPMGGICNVATLPSERNMGHASALMRDTLRALRAQRLCTSVLFPFSFRYYRKFGYELAGNHCQFWCRPHNLPAFSELRHCRAAALGDLPRLAALYETACRRRSCALVRSGERWRELLGELGFQVIVFDRDGVTGYLIARDGLDQYGGRLLAVEELAAESAVARRGLVGHLARYGGEAIEWCASPDELVETGVLRSVAPLREGYKPRGIATVRPMFQFRVVDVLAALKARAPAYSGLTGELTLRIQDEQLRENQLPIAISAHAGTVQILAGQRTEHWLETDIRVFSQIFCGYLCPAEAVSQGLVHLSGPDAAAAAEEFFPRLDPFIPQMDRF
jgi:predicted acetyltransferase